MARYQYIYFLVHDSHERFKVGRSTTPLARWAKIQSHAQTDFAASLVFDLSDDVRPGWVEETFHRALSASRFEMPSHLDGHTEWFDYSVFDVACAFARTHRDLLGIGEGYAISAPPTPDSAPVIKRPRTHRPASAGECFDAAVLHNESVAATMESHISALITSGALLGSAASEEAMNIYFRRDRISPAEVWSRPSHPLFSGARQAWIFESLRADDTFIRLSIASPFYETPGLEDLAPPDDRALHQAQSWLQTTPGFERVRSAVSRLVALAPRLPVGHPAAALGTVGPLLVGPPMRT